jgi:uncharacterized protein
MMLALVLALAWVEPSAAPPAPAREIQIPKNDGWVTDLAGLLSPREETELEALMESYRQGTTNEIALLTVPDLGGEPVERFALEVGRAWKIGGKEQNNGALLVVSKDDRVMRIEVGRGLEGNLTDSISGRIIRDVIVPEFKRGRFAAGLNAGIRAIHAAIGGDYASLPKQRQVDMNGAVGVIVFFFVFAVFALILVINSRAIRSGGRRRGFGGPMIFGPGAFGSSGRSSGGGFGGFGGGGGFSGGGASGRW